MTTILRREHKIVNVSLWHTFPLFISVDDRLFTLLGGLGRRWTRRQNCPVVFKRIKSDFVFGEAIVDHRWGFSIAKLLLRLPSLSFPRLLHWISNLNLRCFLYRTPFGPISDTFCKFELLHNFIHGICYFENLHVIAKHFFCPLYIYLYSRERRMGTYRPHAWDRHHY